MSIKKSILASLVALFFIFLPFNSARVWADTPAVCNNPANDEIKKACDDYATESATLKKLQDELNKQKTKSGVLQKDLNSLISRIKSTQAKISTQISTIGQLSREIGKKEEAITSLENELEREKSSMAQLIKKTYELDQKGPAYVLLSNDTITGFYQDLDDFISIKASLYNSLNHVKNIKSLTEGERKLLQDKQFQALDAKNALESEKGKLTVSQKEAQALLNTSKTAEQKQAALVAQQQKKVAAIQSKLFSFAGGATKAIPFKDAYAYAKEAEAATGVRAAFILGTLKQESNLGANVGTCNRAGDPPSKSYTVMMHPTRDIPIFLKITAALGLDPNTTPVSCRIGSLGWGGAMGPAQFIPSTWALYESRTAAALGKATANPWIARDAIMASALLHEDNGAVGSETKERNAACRYYSGRACAGNSAGSGYANSVMAQTRSIQTDIDYLEQYGTTR